MDRTDTQLTAPAFEGYRLSRQQERLVQLARAGFRTRTLARAHFEGVLDLSILQAAMEDVLEAHESLRTSYHSPIGDRGPILMVVDPADGEHALGRADAERAPDRSDWPWANDEQGEDPASAARPTLAVRTTADGFDLDLSAPRLNVDSLSVYEFYAALSDAYSLRRGGGKWQPADMVQYADFAQWQVDEEAKTSALRQVAPTVSGIAPLHLPLELQSSQWSSLSRRWIAPAGLLDRLRSRAGRVGATLEAAVLASWVAALWYASGTPDKVAVSVALPGRGHDALERAIGCYECRATLPLALSGEMDRDTLIREVAQGLSALRSNDMAASRPESRSPGAAPDVPGFSFLEYDPTRCAGLGALREVSVVSPSEPFKSELQIETCGDHLAVTLRYRASGMDPMGTEALEACMIGALLAFGAAEGGEEFDTLAQLRPLPPVEAHDLTVRTNPVACLTGSGDPSLWHEAVTLVARRFPDAPALRERGRVWTYGELDAYANRLANLLVLSGAVEGTATGLSVERSIEAFGAMLAVSRAGGAFVIIDPSLPVARREFILKEAGVRLVIADSATDRIPADVERILLDRDADLISAQKASSPATIVAAESPAYFLFTSGSTGVPKGVMVSHGNLAGYIEGVRGRLGLDGPVDSVAFGTLATDLGHTAIFLSLTSGGLLDVVPPEVGHDPQMLVEHLAAGEYDLMKITPSHLAALFSLATDPARLMPRKVLVLGGEALSWGWFKLFASAAGSCKLFNHYGPTEATVGVLCGPRDSDAISRLTSTVPLGKPLDHARVYVLDAGGWPVPQGVSGELWIGGTTVALGYLDDAPEAQARFRSDPWSSQPNARMYRTGDRARHLPDGTIEFLGRIDRQIKLRGFRVELAEIEATMSRHERVMGSVAVAAGESTARHIVGYVVDRQGLRGSADWLRPFLEEQLPSFMVPTHLVSVERFPVGATGKIQYSQLPQPAAFDRRLGNSTPSRRTPTEDKVAAIMSELLLLEDIDPEDDFFLIGGHSLLAVQLVTKLGEAFSMKIRLRSIFEESTVAGLSRMIEAQLAAEPVT